MFYFLCFYVLHVKSIMCVSLSLSHVSLFETPWTVAHQAPLSMQFSKQGYWSGLPFPSPGDFTNSGIKPASPMSPALQVDSLPLYHLRSPLWIKRAYYKYKKRDASIPLSLRKFQSISKLF